MTPDILAVLSGKRSYVVAQGDCLEVLRGLPDKSVVVVTDVPYCLGKDIANDNLPWEEYLPWLDARLAEGCRVGKRMFSFFSATKMIRFVRESTCPPQYPINWHKPMILTARGMNHTPFVAHHEPILYWGPMSIKEAGKRGYDSFAFNPLRPSQRRAEGIEHPVGKPLELMLAVMKYWTDPDDIVLDPFCGEGTTLLAALMLGRRAIGVDIDPRWAEKARLTIETWMAGGTLRGSLDGQGRLFGGAA